jgi:hypothetical protein
VKLGNQHYACVPAALINVNLSIPDRAIRRN